MKGRFTTLDLIAITPEIQSNLTGMRVNNVYDIDNKTFIIRFSKQAGANAPKETDEDVGKIQLILQSGIRLHLSDFKWPKRDSPSGFSMKLRKHLKNKRLESMNQLGIDRIVDMQFGQGEFTNHLIVELFSKGNIILTDPHYNILSLVRFYKDAKTNINIAVREKYPLNNTLYITKKTAMTCDDILEIINTSKENQFRKLFGPHFSYGPALLEHCVRKLKNDDLDTNKWTVKREDAPLIEKIFQLAETIVEEIRVKPSAGFILKRIEKASNPLAEGDREYFEDFFPLEFEQNQILKEGYELVKYDSFNKCVDQFYSQIESQKIDAKISQNEKQAYKKLDAIKKDHDKRINDLIEKQKIGEYKARLIEKNTILVESALQVIRGFLAQKLSWNQIKELVQEATESGNPIASRIGQLKLDKAIFSLWLEAEGMEKMLVDIDVNLTTHANARKYFGERKDAAKKEQKTIDVSERALKNVEKKVKQQLKETAIKTNIVLSRKVFWFEKFIWFISSEKFLVIAGRDAQQNELIVKRHLGKNDIYVHAEIHGASSVVIKNYTDGEVPPKTLNEAANFAVCYSASWENKVVCNAYWVRASQVQKTAPSGQFLSVGSFMIRGKKNFIPQQNLILGFGFLFRIDDESYEEREKASVSLENEMKKLAIPVEDDDHVKKNDSDGEVEFPDTVVSIKPTNVPEDNYTIVTTGSTKAKIYTQKDFIRSKLEHEKAQLENAKKEVTENKPEPKKAAPAPKKRGGKKKNRIRKDQLWDSDSENDKKKGKNTECSNNQPETSQDNQESDNEDENSGDNIQQDDTGDNVENDNVENDENKAQVPEEEEEEEQKQEEEIAVDDDDDDDDDDEEGDGSNTNPNQRTVDAKRMLGSLIANPTPKDHLLFAIPVCAPYSAMNSYKFKVKLIPGQTKRGKASKNALEAFLRDKNATEREKDLLKACKDLDIAKNLPAKIKIVATQK